MEKPFNATFFATVAVVMPVLFLALALQSDYLARTLIFSRDVDLKSKEVLQKNRRQRGKRVPPLSLVTDLPLGTLSVILVVLVSLVLIYGILGEILSLLALKQRQASLSTQGVVMLSIVFLIIMSGIAGFWRMVDSLLKTARERTEAIEEATSAERDTRSK